MLPTTSVFTITQSNNIFQVIDHLCILQRLSEEGFSTDDIEDALEVFNGKEEEVISYLEDVFEVK